MWYIPSAMALGVTVLFALVFKDDFKADHGAASKSGKREPVPANA
jgi:hypothetical protein